MDLQGLKNTITAQGQPTIWFTPAGWFFHEQANSVKKTREEVLAAESIEALLSEPQVKAEEPEPEKEIKKPAPKRGNKK